MAEMAYRYRVYDVAIDEYRYSTRYATMTQINRIGGQPLYETGAEVSYKYLTEGWTKKGFDPNNPEA
jgi:hypothetical protein